VQQFFGAEDSIIAGLEGKVSMIVFDPPWDVLFSKNSRSVIIRSDQVFQADINAVADGVKRFLAQTGKIICLDVPWGVLSQI